MSYKGRFVFLVIWLSLCLFLFYIIYGKAKERTIAELNARQLIHARQAEKEIETYINHWLSILSAASEKEHVITLDDFGKDFIAFILNTHKDEIRAVTRVDKNGKIIHTVPYDSKSIGADISHQKHIQAIIRTKRPVMSDVFTAVQGHAAIALHVPVFKDREFRGTLGVLLDFQKIARQFLEVIRIGETGYAWMISAQGVEIYCPVPGHVGKSVFENCREFPAIIAMAQEMLKRNSGVTTYHFDQMRDKRTETVKKQAVYLPVNIVDTFWSLVVASSEKEALASLDSLRNWLVLVIGVLFIGSILFTYFAMRAWGIVKEETKRKEAQEMLRESNDRYRTLFDEAPVMDVTTYNQAGAPVITDCNKLFLSTLGYTCDEVLQQPLRNFYTPESNRKMEEGGGYKRALEGGFLNEERQLVTRAGRVVETLLRTLPEKNSDGQVCGTRAMFIDITQRKRAEKALAAVNTISQTVNQSLNLDQILNDVLDKVMELFKPHSAHIRLLDNTTQEMVLAAHKGHTPEDLKKLVKRKKIEKTVASHAIKTGEAVVIVDPLTDPRIADIDSFGKKIGCRSYINLILYSQDKILGNMAIHFLEPYAYSDDDVRLFTSIGHQVGIAIENAKLYQEKESTIKELSETQQKLQQAQKMQAIGTLAGGIAHDFNNILSAIIGYTELALMKSKGNVIQEDLREVLIASKRATDLVKQILTFSRQGGKEENKPVQARLIVKEALKLLRSSLPTTIEIHENIQSDSVVLADPTQIHQVLMNLCTNAAHSMRDRGGTLSVGLADVSLDPEFTSNHPDIEPGLFIRLTISDSGHGMTSDVLDRIFDPFFTTKASGEGTGMGLAVVHGIVKSLGGAITVYSEPEKGTTFNVFFPVIKRRVQEETRVGAALPVGTERILFVDDELPLVSIGKNILESLGYQVESRTSSIEALELFKAMPEKFDLVITDMTMPNLRGDQLAKQLMGVRPGIPVILCTGFSSEINAEKARTMGVRAFVFKPFLKHDMAKTIRKVLDEAKS